MAQYLLLIYNDERAPQPTGEAMSASYQEFMARRADVLRGGAALEGAATATSVRPAAGGGVAITDGVFIESKEIVAGYFVIEAPDLDAALEIAGEIPVRTGGVEVRPIRLRS